MSDKTRLLQLPCVQLPCMELRITTLGARQPITEQCLPGVGQKLARAQLCTAACLQTEMPTCFACRYVSLV